MFNILETVFLSKEFHQTLLSPICEKYNITYSEMVVLLYVSSHPTNNTATDVVNNRRLTKSAVSMAVHSLKDKGLIQGDFEGGNHRTVHLKLCEKANEIIGGTPASETDFQTEFLDYILAVKVVESVDEAIMHIQTHSTLHSESIITQNEETAEHFMACVDPGNVYWNVSTRFTDGGEFGLGCEMGISTQKLHARGPMGLNELTTYKYKIYGNGQIR